MAVGVVEFLKEKNILVIGGTGFLGKEKILRVQPGVGQIFTLVRAKDLQSAQTKIHKEMIYLELFRLLQERYKEEYEMFMAQTIVPVIGEFSIDGNLGIEEKQRNEVFSKVDVVVNLAATTRFYERYDVSMGVNIVGTINTINFYKKVPKPVRLNQHIRSFDCFERLVWVPLTIFLPFYLPLDLSAPL